MIKAGRWSRSERTLHRIATEFEPLREISFDIERRVFGAAAAARSIVSPVFVCGLARSGSSLIVRALHDAGGFGALTYRDMPFALAPNSWAKLSKQRTSRSVARDHDDGLAHDLDTPEAIEELFWKHTCRHSYIRADTLTRHRPSSHIMGQFREYLALVLLRTQSQRYLSKNNNNILRIGTIASAFPDAIVLHPFREPVQQAASLLNQHRRAIQTSAGDPFRTIYTSSLGHHEFGPDHRPFRIGEIEARGDRMTIDYWLARWIDAYRLLIAIDLPSFHARHFIDFDALAQRGGFDEVFALAEVCGETGLEPKPPPKHHVSGVIDPALLETAKALHAQLKTKARASRPERPIALGAAAGH